MSENIPVAQHAPPLPPAGFSRRVWIGAALAALLVLSVIGIGVGVGVSYALNRSGAGVVGKWEAVNAQGVMKSEFRSNGTGAHSVGIPANLLALMPPVGPESAEQLGVKDGMLARHFKWTISREQKPVLTIEAIEMKMGQNVLPSVRTHYHFKREGETLTLISLEAGARPSVYRKMTP